MSRGALTGYVWGGAGIVVPAPTVTVYEVQVDAVIGGVTYIGEAVPGSASSASVWRIKRMTESGTPTDTAVEWADGTSAFTKVWNDRATYTYS